VGLRSSAITRAVLLFFAHSPLYFVACLLLRTTLLGCHLAPVSATAGLQVLDGLPDPPHRHLPAGEPLNGFHARQAVPDLDQPCSWPLRSQGGQLLGAAEYLDFLSLPPMSFEEAKTVMLFSGSMVNVGMHLLSLVPPAKSRSSMPFIAPLRTISKQNQRKVSKKEAARHSEPQY